MSTRNALGNEGIVEEQAVEQVDAEREELAETPELRPSVEQEIQGKVDTNHPDVTPGGLTLEAEERLLAREWEIGRTRHRIDRGNDADREDRTRDVVSEGSQERRETFQKRAASVNPRADPERGDPRTELSREELAMVNKQAQKMSEKLERWTRAAISRRLAERIADGADVLGAVVGVFEELQTAKGHVIPIASVEEVNRSEVSIEGTVTKLWEPSHRSIAQVGLLEDDSGRTRFTIWEKSEQPFVWEGETVTFRGVAKSWYQGRCSVALTGWSHVGFPDRRGQTVE